ncbi:MAG: hypothetical protein JW870_21515 [Candidatus Delongbacteria bacterium]|nr:hypothetical protein [Candidatus Delongbacteria bacterium]
MKKMKMTELSRENQIEIKGGDTVQPGCCGCACSGSSSIDDNYDANHRNKLCSPVGPLKKWDVITQSH